MKDIEKNIARFLGTGPGLAVLGALLAAAYFSPYLTKGQGAFVLIHDNLDQVSRIPGLSSGRVRSIRIVLFGAVHAGVRKARVWLQLQELHLYELGSNLIRLSRRPIFRKSA
jgi:hypothetical protein